MKYQCIKLLDLNVLYYNVVVYENTIWVTKDKIIILMIFWLLKWYENIYLHLLPYTCAKYEIYSYVINAVSV